MSPFDSSGAQFAWDSTSLQWAMDCLKKYEYSMIQGWRARRPSVHLEFGGLYASALEHYHKLLATGATKNEALRYIVQEVLEATWDSENERPREFDHTSKTRENLLRTIIWYVDHFDPDPLEVIHLADGTPAVEYSFSLELSPEIVYAGHIDRLVRYNGEVYVQDQKTTASTVGTYYFDNYNPDVQMTGYAFAAQVIWRGPVRGVIIDAAQIAVGFSRFERGFTFRTPKQLEEWHHDTLYFINLAREATLRNEFPRNRTACSKFGGCTFRHVCARSPEVREQFLLADFERKEQWNPLNKR